MKPTMTIKEILTRYHCSICNWRGQRFPKAKVCPNCPYGVLKHDLPTSVRLSIRGKGIAFREEIDGDALLRILRTLGAKPSNGGKRNKVTA